MVDNETGQGESVKKLDEMIEGRARAMLATGHSNHPGENEKINLK